MKTFTSSSLAVSFTGTRKEAEQQATDHVRELVARDPSLWGKRFTWRSDDDAGFTVTTAGHRVYVQFRFNAARK